MRGGTFETGADAGGAAATCTIQCNVWGLHVLRTDGLDVVHNAGGSNWDVGLGQHTCTRGGAAGSVAAPVMQLLACCHDVRGERKISYSATHLPRTSGCRKPTARKEQRACCGQGELAWVGCGASCTGPHARLRAMD